MPIDPGIIGQLQPPPPPPSVEQQARTQLLVEEAKQRRQAVIEEAQDSAAIQTAFRAHQSETGTDYQGVLRDLGTASPRAAMKFQVFLTKQQDDAAKQQQEEWKAQSAQAEGLTRLFQGIDKTPDPKASYAAARQLLPPNIAKTLPETYDPTVTERIVAHGTNVKEFNDKENQAFERVMGKGTAEQGIGETLALTTSPEDFKQRIARLSLYVPKDMLQPYLTLGPTPEMLQHAQQAALGTKEVATLAGQAEGRAQTAANQATTQHRLDISQQETQRHNAAMEALSRARLNKPPASAQAASDDAKTIADSIVAGEQQPTLTGLYRYAAPVRAELAKQHYPLAQATEDWNATTKYLSTLNGQQQVRLKQAIGFTTSSLDVVEDLAKQWDAGGFPLLNKAQLALAKNGAIGPKAQAIATKLNAQIADVTSELGTVYKGGNSSTDESLKLAAQNLSSDWSKATLLSNLAQIRQNLNIRSNSMKLAGVSGASASNIYAPKDQGAAPSTEKTISLAVLQQLAKKHGVSEAEERQRATAAGYTVK
jgi:hypothetical protein